MYELSLASTYKTKKTAAPIAADKRFIFSPNNAMVCMAWTESQGVSETAVLSMKGTNYWWVIERPQKVLVSAREEGVTWIVVSTKEAVDLVNYSHNACENQTDMYKTWYDDLNIQWLSGFDRQGAIYSPWPDRDDKETLI